jgi:hypothetical protein
MIRQIETAEDQCLHGKSSWGFYEEGIVIQMDVSILERAVFLASQSLRYLRLEDESIAHSRSWVRYSNPHGW